MPRDKKTKAEKELDSFVLAIRKLKQKYPNISLYGDMNGDPRAFIYDAEKTKTHNKII